MDAKVGRRREGRKRRQTQAGGDLSRIESWQSEQ
jgi:hypothetical protein